MVGGFFSLLWSGTVSVMGTGCSRWAAGPNFPSQEASGSAFSQNFQNQPVAARIRPSVSKGIFTTGDAVVQVMEASHEFVVDFVQGLSRPPQVVGRSRHEAPGVMDGAGADVRDDNLRKLPSMPVWAACAGPVTQDAAAALRSAGDLRELQTPRGVMEWRLCQQRFGWAWTC